MRPVSVHLRATYDADRMAHEVASLAQIARARPGAYETEGWDGIALVQANGRADNTRSPLPSRWGPRPTEALARCPYLSEVLATLPGPILVARLLYLQPGGSAGLHRDPIGWPVGVVRLHVPIVTHPDVELWLGGERMRWAAGELWYGDFGFPHRLANPSDVTRVHLVLDVCVSDALLSLFPSSVVAQLVEGGARHHAPPCSLGRDALTRFVRQVHIPRGSLAGVLAHEDLSLTIAGDEIHARAADGATDLDPSLVLDPLDETTLGMRGYYPGVTLELSPEGALALVHRGRVRLPEGTSTDDERTPWELFTSHTPLDV